MQIRLMDRYSDEEFARIVAESLSYKECLENLGYKSNSGCSTNALKAKIEELNLSTDHFVSSTPRNLTEDMVFCEGGTVAQKVLRNWYKKGQYTPYKCSICGQLPVWNGQELTLILDHINGRHTDDRLENLRWVCPNCNAQLDTTNGKNKIRKEVTINTCKKCGEPISKDATYCLKCYAKLREKTPPVTREELKNLIRTTSFVQIGNKFGVTDNTIRKWCVKYQLPNKARNISQISDEDWSKI